MRYREQLYKSNTTVFPSKTGHVLRDAKHPGHIVQGGSNMSEQDLSRKLEVGDLIVGECRCDPSKKGIVEVVRFPLFEKNDYSRLRFPNGVELWTLGDGTRDYGRTVGGVISFITEERREYRHHCNRDYHNWKHIPKSDFTWEIGDVLYGKCACTPSKFVVFEVYAKESIKVVDCWDSAEIGTTQGVSLSYMRSKGETLIEYLSHTLCPIYRQYNYTKYTKEEWARRVQSISASDIKVGSVCLEKEWTPQDWTRRGFSNGPYTFPKSAFKVIETDKEIRVTPRPTASGVVSVQRVRGCVPEEVSFNIKEDEIEMFFFDIKVLIGKYKVEQ